MVLKTVCVCYNNFDPKKFTDRKPNPFAYFTQIIYYAFLRRIAKEKKKCISSIVPYKPQMQEGTFDEWKKVTILLMPKAQTLTLII